MTINSSEQCISHEWVEKNLLQAVKKGELVQQSDGSWSRDAGPSVESYLTVNSFDEPDCRFLARFLFDYAYAKSVVPFGCQACYKVKIVPQTLRGLLELRDVLENLDYPSKCGVDFYNPYSQDSYAGYVYCDGLDDARAAYRILRDMVHSKHVPGLEMRMTIKRGCSDFEIACGPSDRWTFHDNLGAIEEELRGRFRRSKVSVADYRLRRAKAMVNWIKFAYWIKDDTYLEFTGGRRLYPQTVTFTT